MPKLARHIHSQVGTPTTPRYTTSPEASKAAHRRRGAPKTPLGSRNLSDWHQTQDFLGRPQASHGVMEGFIRGSHHFKTWRSRGRGGSRRGGCDDRRYRPISAARDDHCAAVQLPLTGHSGMPQHFWVLSVSYADRSGPSTPFRSETSSPQWRYRPADGQTGRLRWSKAFGRLKIRPSRTRRQRQRHSWSWEVLR